MVGSPFTSSATTIRITGKTLAPLVAIPLFHSSESRPDGVDGMLGIRPKVSEFSGEHGRPACGIDNPAATCRAFTKIANRADLWSIAIVKLEAGDLCRAP